MRGDLEFLHCYAGGIGTLFARTFALEVFPLVLQILEAKFFGEEK